MNKFQKSLKNIFLRIIVCVTVASASFFHKTKENFLKGLTTPIKSIRNVGLVLLTLYFIYSIAHLVFSDLVLIEDVEIQDDVKNLGINGEVLTDQAIALLLNTAKERLIELPSNIPFMEMYKRSSDHFETETICNFNIPLVPPDFDLFHSGINRVEMNSKTPDQVVKSDEVSIKKLAYTIRKKLGIGDVRQIKPFLWKENNKFTLKLTPLPFDVPEQKYTFKNLDDAPKILADKLLDYIDPEILATELTSSGMISTEKYYNSFHIAKKFLTSKQQELLVINAWVSSQLDFSKTHADIKQKYIFFEKTNQKILNELDFSIYGKYGVVFKAIIANRILLAQCYADCPDELMEKGLEKYKYELEQTPSGLLSLLFLESNRINKKTFYEVLNKLLSKDLIHETDGLFSNLEVELVTASALVNWRKYEEALSVLETPLPKSYRIDLESELSVKAYNLMKASLKTLQGNYSDYDYLWSNSSDKNTCPMSIVASILNGAITNSRFQSKTKLDENSLKDLATKLTQVYPQLEKNGLRSFNLYNEWGGIEHYLGKHKLAYDKYRQALRYEGDSKWALLNWGFTALDNHDYSLAKDLFQQSLVSGPVPNAVLGFITTLYFLNDKNGFLDNFEKFYLVLRVLDHPFRSQSEAIAINFSCATGIKLSKSLLDPSEKILLVDGSSVSKEEYSKMVCSPITKH